MDAAGARAGILNAHSSRAHARQTSRWSPRCPPRSTPPSWPPSCCRSARAGCCRARRTRTTTCSRGRPSTSCDAGGCASRAARSSPNPGDQRAVRIGAETALLVRGQDGVLRAFSNVCRHRGHELLPCDSATNARAIVCPYHSWGYGLDGSLKAAPNFRDVPAFDKAEFPLLGLACQEWHGYVFVNMSGDAGPLRRPARRPRAHHRAVRHRVAGHAGHARVRRRGELEGPVGELQRVLPLHHDPPRAVRGEPARQRLRLRRLRRVGRRVDVAGRRRRRRCRWTAAATASRSPACTTPGRPSATSTCSRTC